MTRKKVIIAIIVVVVLGAAAGANIYFRREQGPSVTAEAIRSRDLEAIVSASGKVQPKRQVNISAQQMGRVTRLAVEEGQRVKAGQFLLEIDPRQLEGQLQRGQASVAAAQSGLMQARVGVTSAEVNVEQAKASLELSQQNLKRQQDLWKDGLTTRESLERAQNEVTVRRGRPQGPRAGRHGPVQEIETREQQIKQEQAGLSTTRYNLTQIVIESPMDGIVTRRNIEEGETAVVGTMNNAGSQLLTIADMSVIEAEVEVDETDIPFVALGQQAKITIDAVEDRTFKGHVTEIGNSPIQANSQQRRTAAGDDVQGRDHAGRGGAQHPPGLHLHRRNHDLDTKQNVTSVPIQALTVSELLFDPQGKIVREDTNERRRRAAPRNQPRRPTICPRAHAERDGRRLPAARQQGGVHARQDRHRRREVLRGARRPEDGRSGHHRSVRQRARAGRRTGDPAAGGIAQSPIGNHDHALPNRSK